ncbi:phosphate signaling complex protein PhoU [Thiocystis violacea]|uniref:phosphate signaling complex protein PhoU n=1 Tax=Thiocystis violacea TaxID=13725 RepID=UPI001906B78E|nr:phosphate signaling complex protein PhoU [Thiocystis violacea]MBK1717763.1 phosphate transport system regulatory protein PhoU [Thiocystis violacea]
MTQSHSLVEKKRDALRQGLVAMAELVKTALNGSLDALRRQDLDLARTIVAADAAINQERRALEQEALVVLAAHQPAGPDLRLIGASLDIITEMERIADHAADVARILLRAEGRSLPEDPVARIVAMGELAATMFAEVMDIYDQGADAALARSAVASEASVDRQEQQAVEVITAWLCQHPGASLVGIELVWIAHHYERVADRATNIAERLVFVATGETPDLN